MKVTDEYAAWFTALIKQDFGDQTVRLPVPGIGAAQHGDLMPQHEQLRVLAGRRLAEQDQPAAEPDEDEVEQAEGHG